MNFNFIGSFGEHRDRITTLAIAPDNQTIVSCSKSGLVKVWNAFTSEAKYEINGTDIRG